MENNGKIPKRIEPDRCRKQLTFNIPTELSFCRSGAEGVISLIRQIFILILFLLMKIM